MAEKPEVNKSQAIRDYFKANPKAKTQEVVDALAKQGITVTTGLVRTVKSKHNQRQAAKKAAKKAAAKPDSRGQEGPEVNKTQAVRDYLKANKKAKARKWSMPWRSRASRSRSSYVRTIKAKHKKRRRAVKQDVVVAKGGVGIPEIKAALAFLKAIGSVAVAKQALAVAVEIKKVV